MVDPDAGHSFVRAQIGDELVGALEDMGVLHPDSDQPVDVEEPPVITFVSAQPPVGGAVVLLVDYGVEARREAGVLFEREQLTVQFEHRQVVDRDRPGLRTYFSEGSAQGRHHDSAAVPVPVDVEKGGKF